MVVKSEDVSLIFETEGGAFTHNAKHERAKASAMRSTHMQYYMQTHHTDNLTLFGINVYITDVAVVKLKFPSG